MGDRLALVGASAVVAGPTAPGPVRRPTWDHLGVRAGAGVGVEDGRVALVAPDAEVLEWCGEAPRIECEGRLVTAGLVDCHTHAIFGRPRLEDQARRAAGESYQAIAAAAREGGGGAAAAGILSSVSDLRARSEDALAALARPRLARMALLGTTTVEVKSGYGLDVESELAMLRTARRLSAEGLLHIVPTFLGAHEIPLEYRGRREAYLRLVVEEMLPAVAAGGLARFCDVFCEPGVFSVAESETILERARSLGLALKLHADELEPSGGAELAARLGAVSADHLGAVSAAGIEALAASPTVAVLLPGTLLFLGKSRQAPARVLVDAGAVVALATDFNPGSSPTLNLPLIMALGVSQLRLQPAEAFLAATVNAAAALGESDGPGRVRVGAAADLAIWNVRDVRELAYWYGVPLAWQVLVAGRPCHLSGAPLASHRYAQEPLSPPLT